MLSVGLLAAAGTLSACVGKLPPPGIELLKQIDKSYRQGDYRKTVAKADEFLVSYGHVEAAGEAYYLRGLAYASLKDRPKARMDFEAALRSAKRSDLVPLAHVALGNLEFEGGQWTAAGDHYRQAVEKLPNDSPKDEVLYRLGQCHARLGQWRIAKTWFAQLLLQFPASPREPWARAYLAAEGFAIQCGKYPDYSTAQRQVDDLRNLGLPAKLSLDAQMKFYLVQVGRFETYAQARAFLPQVVRAAPEAVIVP